MHCLECEQWGNSDEQIDQVESNIQNVHLHENGIIRCILTCTKPGTEQKSHICVFVVTEGDKMYMVCPWPDYLQERLEEDVDVKKLKVLNYDEEISRALNA